MFVELNNILDFSEKNPPLGKSLLLTESETDGSFLIHHLVSLFLKGGHNVCLVGFSQSLNHYNHVATKMATNLTAAKDSGNFIFVEGLKQLGQDILFTCKGNGSTADTSGVQSWLRTEKDKNHLCVKAIYDNLKDGYTSLKDWQSKCSLLLIDDLSILFSLGIDTQGLIWLTHYLRELTSSGGSRPGCFASFLHLDRQSDDEEVNLLHKHLQHHSDLQLHCAGLTTGYSKEVHGQLHARWNDIGAFEPGPNKSRTVQYRITDKSVNFFAVGMSAAVL